MRELTISRHSLYLRVFLWIWDADPEKLNICKLFWGTILFPLAFAAVQKKAFGFIPRYSIIFFFAAIVALVWGLATVTIIWFAIAGFYIILAFIFGQRKQTEKKKEQALSGVSGRGSVALERVLDRFIDWTINLEESKTSRRIEGFFSVFTEYLHSFKRRYCPMVKVV